MLWSVTFLFHYLRLWHYLSLTFWICEPLNVTGLARPTLSIDTNTSTSLSPSHHASLFPPLDAGWRPDLGGEWPQLPEHPSRRGCPSSEVFTTLNDDGERCRTSTTCPNSGGRDQVDRQLSDRRELRRQQCVGVSLWKQKIGHEVENVKDLIFYLFENPLMLAVNLLLSTVCVMSLFVTNPCSNSKAQGSVNSNIICIKTHSCIFVYCKILNLIFWICQGFLYDLSL